MPESPHWLVRKQPRGALERASRAMQRLGHPPVASLPEVSLEMHRKSMGDLFSPALLPITVIVTVAYFLQITSYYFILKWVPKIVADTGFSAASAGDVLVFANIGAIAGAAVLCFLKHQKA
ncbi:MAG: MFS transporter [Acidobacteria bacterium]|nr:MFS transporter [Acidobacteriota bacterium]